MERKEKIFNMADKRLQIKFERSLSLIDEYFLCNKEAIHLDFIKSINCLFEIAKKQQEQGVKRDIAYMNICFLRTSFLTESYDFMASLYDDKFYVETTETRIYFNLNFIFEHINRDIEEIEEEIKIFPTLKKFEIKELKFSYAQYYFIYAMKIIKELCEDIEEKINCRDLKITEDFKIIVGGHMEEGLKL
ncbi:MAG: hypothetical protein FWE02_06720 [Defluviitaleaceae bacterium]|nr:hypothetical protein [Defluviitaleaceae bacterium]